MPLTQGVALGYEQVGLSGRISEGTADLHTSKRRCPGGELGANQRPTGAIEVQGERQSRTCSSYALHGFPLKRLPVAFSLALQL